MAAYPGGLEAQLPKLTRTMYHEMHHLARGWTILGNQFGPGIAIAAVNEGLAEVFAEIESGVELASSEYPPEADAWAREILALPAPGCPALERQHLRFVHVQVVAQR